MSKYGLSMADLKGKKSVEFMDKIKPWIDQLPSKKRVLAYFCLVLKASEQVPLVHQDEVISKAQDLYYETRQERG